MLKRVRLLVAVVALMFTLGFGQSVFAQLPPGDAGETTEALANAAVAAVVSISQGVVDGGDIANYSEAVSHLINNPSIRLLTNNIADSLGDNNSRPHGNAEKTLLEGIFPPSSSGITWLPSGGDAITIFPLSWDAHPGCIICHSEFQGRGPGEIIGGLIIRVDN